MEKTMNPNTFEEIFLCFVKISREKESLVACRPAGRRDIAGIWEALPPHLIKKAVNHSWKQYQKTGKFPKSEFTFCVSSRSDCLDRFGADFESRPPHAADNLLEKWEEAIRRAPSPKKKSKRSSIEIIEEFIFD